MKFLETIFTKFPMVVKLICIGLLIILIVFDLISLIKNGNTIVDPISYVIILILICIEEIKSNSEKNIYLISTSNDKVRKINPDAKAKTRPKSDSNTKSEAK